MLQKIESISMNISGELEIEHLIQLREIHKFSVPELIETNDEIEESVQEIERYEINDEEESLEADNDDPMIPMMDEEDFFESENFVFDIPTASLSSSTMIEQTSSSQMFEDRNRRKFECRQCEKTFKEARHLTIHEHSHLPKEQKFTHQCQHCDKKYSSIFSLRHHIKHVHVKSPAFQCQFCSKEFSRKANLDSHLSHVHTRDRNFECDICGLKVKTKGILRNHKLLHSNNPADLKECQICSKQFKTQNQLINHIARHPKTKKIKSHKSEAFIITI